MLHSLDLFVIIYNFRKASGNFTIYFFLLYCNISVIPISPIPFLIVCHVCDDGYVVPQMIRECVLDNLANSQCSLTITRNLCMLANLMPYIGKFNVI